MRPFFVINKSKLITNKEATAMTAACGYQLRHHAWPIWGIPAPAVHFVDDESQIIPKSIVISILDDADQAGDLGWHTEDNADNIYGHIFAKPCLDAGSTALEGDYAVSSVLSHEMLETYADQHCNLYADSYKGFLVAYEICDPVEAAGYTVRSHGLAVQISDFVTPEWFDPIGSAGEQFDYMDLVKNPLSMAKGGYWVQMPSGKEQQKFGEVVAWEKKVGFDLRGDSDKQFVFSSEFPEWKKEIKMAGHGRSAQRVA